MTRTHRQVDNFLVFSNPAETVRPASDGGQRSPDTLMSGRQTQVLPDTLDLTCLLINVVLTTGRATAVATGTGKFQRCRFEKR